jgi:hypothetical protein
MTNNDIDLCRMAQAPCNALLDAEARIAELTRERDEAQRENMDMVWQRRSAEFRADAAEARIAKMEAAMKPFASMPCGICENDDPAIGVERCSDDTPVYVTRHDHGGQTVTAGHFRAARAALEDKL